MKFKPATITWLLATTAAIALAPVHGAHAQTTPAATTPPPPGSAAHGPALEEIVVTAERRKSRLQDVPISITALTPAALQRANITSTRDLAMITPGLKMELTGIFVQPAIRGITSVVSFVEAEANSATYVDGVYQQNMLSAFYELPDVQQIEVLKGPQGTLFGRNATGGAILLTTEKPDLQRPTGHGTIGYGSFNDVVAKGFVSIPIVQDKVALSITAYAHKNDGWERNLTDGDKREGSQIVGDMFRLKLRFKPWEGADFTLAGLYSYQSNFDQLRMSNLNGNNVATTLGVPPSQIASQPWTYSQDYASFLKSTQWAASLHGDIQLGPGTLTTISAYRRQRDFVHLDGDNSALPLAQNEVNGRSEDWSQELIYATNQLGRFRGTFGAFYYHADTGMLPVVVNNGLLNLYARDKTDAYAGFGEISYNITDRLILTGGLRYSYETKSPFATITFGAPLVGAVPALAPPKTFSSLTPKASLLYKVTDDTNVYFTYSQGFKSGLFNTPSLQATAVLPETVTSYEVGFKSRPVRSVSLNGAAFYYDYSNLQIPTIFQVGPTFVSVLQNAASATIYGVELSGDWQVTRELLLSAGGTWLHARYQKFPDAAVDVPIVGGGGNVTLAENLDGFTMIRSPDWSGDISATYTKETNAGTFEASGTVYYSSKFYFDSADIFGQKAYTTINASLAWNPPHNNNIQLRAWVKNLTNQAVLDSTVISNSATAVHYAAPRLFGVEASYKF